MMLNVECQFDAAEESVFDFCRIELIFLYFYYALIVVVFLSMVFQFTVLTTLKPNTVRPRPQSKVKERMQWMDCEEFSGRTDCYAAVNGEWCVVNASRDLITDATALSLCYQK
jgi:hypothetical protein